MKLKSNNEQQNIPLQPSNITNKEHKIYMLYKKYIYIKI